MGQLISLYSRRSPIGTYRMADYDPEARTLHITKGPSGSRVPSLWRAEVEPWEPLGVVVLHRENGEIIGESDFLPARWERAVEGQDPSPGYGYTPAGTASDS